jgi:aspartate racemase
MVVLDLDGGYSTPALPDDGVVAATTSQEETPGLIGVLGGMGPLATIDFMRKVMIATPAVSDQDHVPLIVSSIPRCLTARRRSGATAFRRLPPWWRSGRAWRVPVQAWWWSLQHSPPLVRRTRECARIADAAPGRRRTRRRAAKVGVGAPIGLLCTDATLASGLYVNRGPRSAKAAHVQWALPTATEMIELVMPGIAAVKAGALASWCRAVGCRRRRPWRGAVHRR